MSIASINPFATSDAYMRQLFYCLQWYAGSERVNSHRAHPSFKTLTAHGDILLLPDGKSFISRTQ